MYARSRFGVSQVYHVGWLCHVAPFKPATLVFIFLLSVKTAFHRDECLADLLRDSMKGAGTNDDALIRLVLAFSEVGLLDKAIKHLSIPHIRLLIS